MSFKLLSRDSDNKLPTKSKRSQSALEYMMTYGWAILIIVIVAVILYSMGIFNPAASISSAVTGFSGLGSVTAQVIPNSGLVLILGNSIGYNIKITNITISLNGKTSNITPNSIISVSSFGKFFIPFASVSPSSSYSFSVKVYYTEPGQVLPGPYVSTGVAYGTASSSLGYYQKIIITNSQISPTPAPFQQMINLSVSYGGWYSVTGMIAPNYQNVEFFSSNGLAIPSWLENYSSSQFIYWIKLQNGIPASSSVTVYIVYFPKSDNVLNNVNDGEAPQIPCGSTPTSICSVYAEYDDGANVFNFYDNFAGRTLDSNVWTTGGTNGTSGNFSGVIVDNGLMLIGNSFGYLTWIAGSGASDARYQLNESVEAYGPQVNGGSIGFTNSPQSTTPSNGSFLACSNADNCYLINSLNGATSTSLMGKFDVSGNYYVLTTTLTSVNTITSINYTFGKTLDSSDHTKQINGMYISLADEGTSFTAHYQWIRARAYPPNGVMPVIIFGGLA